MDPLALKEKGNEEFKNNKYTEAIYYYTQAIVNIIQQCSNDSSILYSNRAQCHRKLSNWKQCYEDALIAIEMQENNIKAHMLCGQALMELGKSETNLMSIENGLKRLTKAYSLCSSQNKRNFEKDILIYIGRGKKLLWFKQQENETNEKKELLQNIQKLEENNKKTPEAQKTKNLEELRSILFDNPAPRVIPEFIVDPISKSVMKDPVILPSGNSYDKASLDEYMNSKGNIEPLTK